MIGGVMHHFHMTFNRAYYKTPYTTLIMLSSSIPRLRKKKEKKPHLFDMLSTAPKTK